MLASTLLLALASMVAASPVCRVPTSSTAVPPSTSTGATPKNVRCEFAKYTNEQGVYQDQGCGTNIKPGPGLCMQTEEETLNGSGLYLNTCVESGPVGDRKGGRWSLDYGRTQIKNMQAKVANFCLTVTEEFDDVKMKECAPDNSDPMQMWDTIWTKPTAVIKLADKDWCLSLHSGERQVALEKCDASSKSQQINVEAWSTDSSL